MKKVFIMRNTMKVVRWEIKRNIKSKSFIIGLFLTPAIIAFFLILPFFFENDNNDTKNFHLFVNDDAQMFETVEKSIAENELDQITIKETSMSKNEVLQQVKDQSKVAYVEMSKDNVEQGVIPLYTHGEIDEMFRYQLSILEESLKYLKLERLGFSKQEMEAISQGVSFDVMNLNKEEISASQKNGVLKRESAFKRIVPGVFAGIILLSIVYTGMMTFQSASQERKDKMAEIILSSLTPNELMQGKIFGYFVLGIIQVFIWMALAVPIVIWKFEVSILKYLLTPETFVLVMIAILGYLLFAALFVGLGATIEDVSASGSFQGMVLMLPFVPVILIRPLLEDPNGLVAQVGSYIPFTSPAVLIFRLTLLEEWPWMEIIISIGILLISIWFFTKLAGKVFKIGIQKYGKNATVKEIWKWVWAS